MCWHRGLTPAERRERTRRDLDECLKLPEYVRLLDQLPPGVETIELVGGGEPLLYPEVDLLVREIKGRGFKGLVITNGVALTPRLSATLVETGWDMIRVSVNAGDADTYRQIHGRDDFDRVVENLAHLNRLRFSSPGRASPKLFVLQVVLPHNADRVESLFSFAEEVAADCLYFDRVIPFDPAVRLEPDAARRAAADIASLAASSRIPCNLEWILHRLEPVHPPPVELPRRDPPGGCLAGYDEAVISSTGEVRPCCVLDRVLGSIRTTPFREIWFGAEYESLRKGLLHGVWEEQCRRCWMHGSLIA
jgi:radical SAM protein with 4Fe4S-binding SPASM domain